MKPNDKAVSRAWLDEHARTTGRNEHEHAPAWDWARWKQQREEELRAAAVRAAEAA